MRDAGVEVTPEIVLQTEYKNLADHAAAHEKQAADEAGPEEAAAAGTAPMEVDPATSEPGEQCMQCQRDKIQDHPGHIQLTAGTVRDIDWLDSPCGAARCASRLVLHLNAGGSSAVAVHVRLHKACVVGDDQCHCLQQGQRRS